jgi:hypothetical protein
MDNRLKRSDNFYYIEFYDKAEYRISKIDESLDRHSYIKPKYYNSSYGSIGLKKYIFLSLFWKKEETAKDRISSFKSKAEKRNLIPVIKKLSRNEFIDCIPDVIPRDITKSERDMFLMNFDLKVKEEEYLEKINSYTTYYNG